jgi:hypothetical protein
MVVHTLELGCPQVMNALNLFDITLMNCLMLEDDLLANPQSGLGLEFAKLLHAWSRGRFPKVDLPQMVFELAREITSSHDDGPLAISLYS